MLSDHSLETLKEKIDCMEVCRDMLGLAIVRKSGKSFVLCPFHDDGHPSMLINRSYVYCFSCQTHADAFDLVQKVRDCTWLEAAQALAAFYGVSLDDGAPVTQLPTYILSAEMLRAVGIQERQLAKALFTESPASFWGCISRRATYALSRYKTMQSHLSKSSEILPTLAKRIEAVMSLSKIATTASRKKPGEYILRFGG